MVADPLGDALADAFRYERGIVAARRFISRRLSRHKDEALRHSQVVAFLRKRRESLPENQIEDVADEAMHSWLKSRANRYRG
jgi:hypothetical protein